MASCYNCGATIVGQLHRREVVTGVQRRLGVRGRSATVTRGIRSHCEPCTLAVDRQVAREKRQKAAASLIKVALIVIAVNYFVPGWWDALKGFREQSASSSSTAQPVAAAAADTGIWHPVGWPFTKPATLSASPQR